MSEVLTGNDVPFSSCLRQVHQYLPTEFSGISELTDIDQCLTPEVYYVLLERFIETGVVLRPEAMMQSWPFADIADTISFPYGYNKDQSVLPLKTLFLLSVNPRYLPPVLMPYHSYYGLENAVARRLTNLIEVDRSGDILIRLPASDDYVSVFSLPLPLCSQPTRRDEGKYAHLRLLNYMKSSMPYPFLHPYLKEYFSFTGVIPSYPAHALVKIGQAMRRKVRVKPRSKDVAQEYVQLLNYKPFQDLLRKIGEII